MRARNAKVSSKEKKRETTLGIHFIAPFTAGILRSQKRVPETQYHGKSGRTVCIER